MAEEVRQPEPTPQPEPATREQPADPDEALTERDLDEVAGGFHFVHRANSSSPG